MATAPKLSITQRKATRRANMRSRNRGTIVPRHVAGLFDHYAKTIAKSAASGQMLDFNWDEYDSAAEWCANHGVLPTGIMTMDTQIEIDRNPEAFALRVRIFKSANVAANTDEDVWRLSAPEVGVVINAYAGNRSDIAVLLSDRKANGQAFPGEFVMYPWRSNEIGYCLDLLRTEGNANVPRDSILSYFTTQAAHARLDKRQDVWDALQVLATKWAEYLNTPAGIAAEKV